MAKRGRPRKSERANQKTDEIQINCGRYSLVETGRGTWTFALRYKTLENKRDRIIVNRKLREDALMRGLELAEERGIINNEQQSIRVQETVKENLDKSGLAMMKVADKQIKYKVTLHDLMEQFADIDFRLGRLDIDAKRIESKTKISYIDTCKKIDWLIGDTFVVDVSEDVIYFMLKFYRDPPKEYKELKPASQSLLNKMFIMMRSVLDFAVQMKILDENIMRDETRHWKIPNQLEEHEPVMGYTEEEIKIMFGILKEQGLEYDDLPEEERYSRCVYDLYTWFNTMLFTGARSEEIRAIQWKDIDFAQKTLSINKAIKLKGKTQGLKYYEVSSFIGKTKTKGSKRILHLDDDVLSLLEGMKNFNKKNGIPTEKDDFVFCSIKYKTHWSGSGLKEAINDLFRWKGLKDLHLAPHRLRHTCASMLENNGASDDAMMSYLGLTRAQTLRVYTDRGKLLQQRSSKMVSEAIKKDIGIQLIERTI